MRGRVAQEYGSHDNEYFSTPQTMTTEEAIESNQETNPEQPNLEPTLGD